MTVQIHRGNKSSKLEVRWALSPSDAARERAGKNIELWR